MKEEIETKEKKEDAHGTKDEKGDTSKPNNTKHSFLISFVSGGIAGITAKSAVAPLERVKIFYQVHGQHYGKGGIVGAMKGIANREGSKGLFRGNLATVARIFPYAAIQFVTYERTTKLIKDRQNQKPLSTIQHLLAGAWAGSVSVLFTYPLDLARARLAVEIDQQPSLTRALSKTFSRGGIRELYRGIQPTLYGILPYAGINFAAFAGLKESIPTKWKNEDGQIPIPLKLACGGLAGAMGQTVAYPLDVVRRKMQTAGHATVPEIDHSLSTLRLMRHIIKTQGVRALFKGLSINYIKVVPAVSISFTTYEFMKGFLTKHFGGP
eukprot:Phypoly_transcript_10890.p1 GENE.Phypoly_transcript_10890~~Phypoly_transcript_10890.p1  ORF type:complete len:324 (+),score=35.76 Phypoly_transcript_10890:263-1234(+)